MQLLGNTQPFTFRSMGNSLSDSFPNRAIGFRCSANLPYYQFQVKASSNQSSRLYQTRDRRNQRLSGPQFLPLPNAEMRGAPLTGGASLSDEMSGVASVMAEASSFEELS